MGGRGEEEKFIVYCKRGAPGSQRPVVNIQHPPRLTQPNNMLLESKRWTNHLGSPLPLLSQPKCRERAKI